MFRNFIVRIVRHLLFFFPKRISIVLIYREKNRLKTLSCRRTNETYCIILCVRNDFKSGVFFFFSWNLFSASPKSLVADDGSRNVGRILTVDVGETGETCRTARWRHADVGVGRHAALAGRQQRRTIGTRPPSSAHVFQCQSVVRCRRSCRVRETRCPPAETQSPRLPSDADRRIESYKKSNFRRTCCRVIIVFFFVLSSREIDLTKDIHW